MNISYLKYLMYFVIDLRTMNNEKELIKMYLLI